MFRQIGNLQTHLKNVHRALKGLALSYLPENVLTHVSLRKSSKIVHKNGKDFQ